MKGSTQKILDDFLLRNNRLSSVKDEIFSATEKLIECAKNGKILVCGNGGSAADSEHISGELLKSFKLKRDISTELKERLKEFGDDGKKIANTIEGGIKCIPLVDFTSAITAFSNDKSADLAFSQLVNALGDEGDALLAVSTGGNAENVCFAAITAKAKGLTVISLTGESGGKLKALSDVCITCPETETYLVQEMHLPVYHAVCLAIENEIFGD